MQSVAFSLEFESVAEPSAVQQHRQRKYEHSLDQKQDAQRNEDLVLDKHPHISNERDDVGVLRSHYRGDSDCKLQAFTDQIESVVVCDDALEVMVGSCHVVLQSWTHQRQAR